MLPPHQTTITSILSIAKEKSTDKKAMAPNRSDPWFVNGSPTVYDLYDLGKEMMNRAGRNLGTLSVGGPEHRKF